MVDEAAARIAPDDRGFLLGDGIFETVAVKRGQAKRLVGHLARLRHDADVIGLKVPWDDDTLVLWIAQTTLENDLADAVVRITITRGPGPRGLLPPTGQHPTVLITAALLPPTDEPARLIIGSVTRRNEHSPLSGIKSINYLDNIVARREAHARDADDAVILNTQGRVAETTVANIFALIGGGIITPPITEGALPGLMRADVLKLARGDEAPITVAGLKNASEVFTSNALGIRPVISIDGQPVGDGEPGLITQLLAARL